MKVFVCENCSHIEFTNKSCANCENKTLLEKKFTGLPKLISFTEVRLGFGKFLNSNPYILAIIELETGFKILTKLENKNYEIGSILEFIGLNNEKEPIFN